ncbi:MAG: bactofilin family protein [Candidatus Binataceae bacterium]
MRLTDSASSDWNVGISGNPSTPVASIPRAPGQAWVEERTRVAVGRNINVSGKLVFQEPVRIEGHFRGEVSSSELVVLSETATVEGRVRTPRVLVLGVLTGEVIGAKTVVLGPCARVTGSLETETLTVCEGAFLQGDIRVAPGVHGRA